MTLRGSVIVAFVAVLSGCESILGLVLGESPLRRLTIEVTHSQGALMFTAQEAFAGISCSTYAPKDVSKIRVVWWASCPKGKDCMHSVRYGDPALETKVAPETLLPGQCYICNVGGSNGRGDVIFELRPDGTLGPCPKPGEP
jgi:hypothetical protein